MRLERVGIVNFRRFKSVDLELPDGIIGLVGRNGAGKSTFLEAVGWCLYGHDAARTGKDLIKRRGCAPGDDVSVSVAFRFGGQMVEVKRELLGKGGSHVASVTVDGALVVPAGAQSHRETTEYLSRLFHMDREAFFTSLVARQRELSALSDAKPGERKRILLSLLRIDAIDEAIQQARLERRDAQKELQGLRSAFEDVDALKKSLEASRVTSQKAAEESESLEIRIRDFEESVETRRLARAQSRQRAEKHRSLTAELQLADSRAADAAKAVAQRAFEVGQHERAAKEASEIAPRLAGFDEARQRVESLTALRLRHEELSRVQVDITATEKAKAQAQSLIEASTVALAQADAVRGRLSAIPAEREAVETQLAEARSIRERLAQARLRHDEAERVRRQLHAAEAEAKAAAGAAAEAERALAAQNAVRRLQKRLPEERRKHEALSAEAQRGLAENEARAQELRRMLDHVQSTAERITEIGPESPCPTCTRPLGSHFDALLADFAKTGAEQEAALAALAPVTEAAQAKDAEARRVLADLREVEEELRDKLQALARAESERASALERAKQAESRAEEARVRLAELLETPWDPALAAQAEADEASIHARLREVQAEESRLRAAAERLARDEERLAGAKQSVAEADARLARLRDQASALAAEPFDPAALVAALRTLQELERLQTTHTRLMAVADLLPEAAALLSAAKEVEAAANATLVAAKARLAELAFDPAAHEAAEKATEDAEQRLQDARLNRERLRNALARAQEEEKRVLEALAKQEALREKERAFESRLRLLERLAGERQGGLLPDFKDHLISRVRPLLSTHAGRLFRELTDGRYADLELGDDYDLLVHEEGQAFALSRFSGGEGDLANLCLRLAVGQVVAERAGTEGFGFLALDEIFGSQDEVRKGNILRALGSLTGRFRQILLITHIEDVKEAAEHVLRVVAHEDGTSSVVLDA